MIQEDRKRYKSAGVDSWIQMRRELRVEQRGTWERSTGLRKGHGRSEEAEPPEGERSRAGGRGPEDRGLER